MGLFTADSGTILMDLSKAFDTLNHDLLVAKLHVYGFSRTTLMFIKSFYLTGGRELK